jgi:ribokinase
VVVGSLNVDLVTRVERIPRPGETVMGGDLAALPGGKGANQALAAARTGAATTLVGRVGDDAFGPRYRAELGRRGVDVSAVLDTPGVATGQAFICVSADGENSIVVVPGANARLSESDVDMSLPPGDAVLLLQLELPLPVVRHAAQRAAAHRGRVVLNASPVRPVPPELLRMADPLIVNRHEAGLIAALVAGSGSAADGPDAATLADRLLALGVRSVVITLGRDGAYASTVDGSARVAAPPVEVVDTTGAGDVFAGTLAAHLSAGAPLLDAVQAAVHTATQCTTHPGAQGWSFEG